WDGWPDGDFSVLLSMDFVQSHDNLQVHWATRVLGGRGGSTQAETWQRGNLSRRQCLGVIECQGDECMVFTRPQTRKSGIENQLAKLCTCGAKLVHRSCDVRSTLHSFSEGVYYQNAGRCGPAESVTKISPLLVNADSVKYERRKVVRGPASGGFGGDHFLKEYAKLEQKNPNFFRTSSFGQVSVVVMPTPFMASRLVKMVAVDTEAVNGIVSDAAHGFWADHNNILMISSTYEPIHLQCWVPGLISYSNGGTAEHYRIHFFELFCSIAEECRSHSLEISDDILANVVDFSEAQRNGFILAYVDFWLQHAPGERDVPELLETAPKLLKGCRQHFRSQVARIKKISGVVDPAQ
ncbi:hypothetical protein K438DRAFT_1551160, partial [Mycena galopus ATCC 62051]